MSCYPFLGLLSGVMQHLQYYCLHWLFRTRGTLSCDVTPVLALTGVTNTCNFLLLPLFFTPFGSTIRGKGNPKIASIGHSVLGNPKVRYDTGFSFAFFYINTCQCCYPFLLPLLGLRSGVMARLRYLHWPVRTRRSLRYAMSVILTLVLLHK